MSNQGATGWHKSSRSSQGSAECIEQGVFPDGLVAVRDTKDRCQGDVIGVKPESWKAFVGFAASFAG